MLCKLEIIISILSNITVKHSNRTVIIIIHVVVRTFNFTKLFSINLDYSNI